MRVWTCPRIFRDILMQGNRLLKVSLVGTVIAALCCFTPVLVILFGFVGLSALVGYLDYVLLPALVVFVLVSVFAFFKRGRI